MLTSREAWAAGFGPATTDGRELLARNPDGAREPVRVAVTFYNQNAGWIGNLRLPAGMYKLTPLHTLDGWQLAIATQLGKSGGDAQPEQAIGSVALKTGVPVNPGGTGLAVSIKPLSEGCAGSSHSFDFRELHFSDGVTDLFVCVRSEPEPQDDEESGRLNPRQRRHDDR